MQYSSLRLAYLSKVTVCVAFGGLRKAIGVFCVLSVCPKMPDDKMKELVFFLLKRVRAVCNLLLSLF